MSSNIERGKRTATEREKKTTRRRHRRGQNKKSNERVEIETMRRRGKLSVCVILLLLLLIFFQLILRCDEQIDDRPCDTVEHQRRTFLIPPRIHFITGQGDGDEEELNRFGPRLQQRRMERASTEFRLIDYLVLLAARRSFPTDELFLHYSIEPTGFWWNKARNDSDLNLIAHRIPLKTSIFRHRLVHHAHRTDLVRLEILDEYGGIYLDLDLLVLKSFAQFRRNSRHVEAMFAWENEQFRALSNAMIIAPRQSKFLRRLRDSYQSFNSSCWACHSVLLSAQLASIYSAEVFIFPSKTFFQPSWTQIDELYLSNQYDFRENYACHLWNSYVGQLFLNNLTANELLRPQRMTTFHRMIHQAIGMEKLQSVLNKEFLP